MTTIIGELLEQLTQLDEAQSAGRAERRKFFRVTSPTKTNPLSTIVEAPGKSRAVHTAGLVWGSSDDPQAAEAAANADRATVELVSAFTPNEIPFFAEEDKTDAISDEVFAAAKREQIVNARKQNLLPYAMPTIPMAHPDSELARHHMIPLWQVPEYVERGFKVLGRASAQRRVGFSTTPYAPA